MMHETYRIERLASDTSPKHWSEWMTQITSRDNEVLAGKKITTHCKRQRDTEESKTARC